MGANRHWTEAGIPVLTAAEQQALKDFLKINEAHSWARAW